MKKEFPKYNCPQEGMYAVGQLVCELCNANMNQFKLISPAYTPEYIDEVKKQIALADSMPGQNNRTGRKRVVKVDLLTSKDISLNNWQLLKGYIIKTWPDPAMQAAKLSTAGANLYRLSAGKSQWSVAGKLLQTGDMFITENMQALMQNNIMPANFSKDYKESMNTYLSLWNDYSLTNSNNETESNNKIIANNNVYDKLIQICKDGRRIFKSNPTMQKQFAFTQLLARVGFGGTAGIKIRFTYGPQGLPVPDVDGVSTDLKYAAISNAKGLFVINRMTEGTHTFTFSAAGFENYEATVTLTAGVKSRFDFTMKKEANELQYENVTAKAA